MCIFFLFCPKLGDSKALLKETRLLLSVSSAPAAPVFPNPLHPGQRVMFICCLSPRWGSLYKDSFTFDQGDFGIL